MPSKSKSKQGTPQRKKAQTPKANNNNNNNQKGKPKKNIPNNFFHKDVETPFSYTVHQFGSQKQITIHQSSAEDTWPGGALWDCGILLSQLFCNSNLSPIRHNSSKWNQLKILELGSGVGLTGLVASVLGARLTLLTDLPIVIDKITKPNITLNAHLLKGAQSSSSKKKQHLRVQAQPLTWGDETEERNALRALSGGGGGEDVICYPDLIIAGDVSYQHKPGAPSHFDALLQTVLNLSDENTLFVFGHRVRMDASNDLLDSFLEHLEPIDGSPIAAHEIDPRSFPKEITRENIAAHIMRRRR